jgi:hypothetical protein
VGNPSLAIFVTCAFALSGCDRPAPASPPAPELTPAPVEVKAPPSAEEQEVMAALAMEGAQALGGLSAQSDVHHGATWLKGNVPPEGSTAYLYLGRLGETGASTLRFVVRYEGKQAANLGRCTVIVDGVDVGSFLPAPNRVDQPSDGSVRQLADIHFDDARPAVLAMINGQSAIIRTADGKEIRLDRVELDEMRRVLSAYLHLQAQP